MDKKLNRQIGYFKQYDTTPKKEAAPKIPEKTPDAHKSDLKPQNDELPTSEAIWSWLEKNAKFFKIKALCEEIGYDEGNFNRLKKKRGEISKEYIKKIHPIIKRYGYQ